VPQSLFTVSGLYPVLTGEIHMTENNALQNAKQSAKYISDLADAIHVLNRKWWYSEQGIRLIRNKGELLCLVHSEISECMEGERKNLMDDHLPNRKMAEVEIADAIIRLLDYGVGFGYDISGAIIEKLEFNSTRPDHKYEARNQANGKKW